jgi:hypothetical protein
MARIAGTRALLLPPASKTPAMRPLNIKIRQIRVSIIDSFERWIEAAQGSGLYEAKGVFCTTAFLYR